VGFYACRWIFAILLVEAIRRIPSSLRYDEEVAPLSRPPKLELARFCVEHMVARGGMTICEGHEERAGCE